MAFDVEGALRSGYSLTEVADYLGQQNKFDTAGARQAGYSDSELVHHLMGASNAPKTGFIAGMRSGYESLKGDIGSIGAGLGVSGAEEYARKQQRLAAEKAQLPEFTESPFEYVKTLAGQSVPYMVAPLVAAVAAPETAALATIGRVALTAKDLAATAAGATQFFGSNLSRQLEEGKSAKDLDIVSAAASAPFQAALDTVGLKFIPGLRKVFGEAGEKLTDEQLRAVIKTRMTETLANKVVNYGAKAVQTSGVEGFTEAGQAVLERAQAGLNITDPEARKEYFDNFLGGAILGGGLSVPGHAIERSSQQGQYENLLKKDAAEAAKQKAAETTTTTDTGMGFKPLSMLPDTYAEAVQEVERLKQEPQTEETKARIAELEAYKQRLNIEDIEGMRRKPNAEPKSLEDQIKNQTVMQGEFRETADLPTREVTAAEETPVVEKEAPTVLEADTLNATGLSRQSGIYKQLVGKDLTNLKDLDAVMQIVERAKTNPNLTLETKQALDSIATNAFNVYGKQAEMFGPRGKVLEPIKPEKVTSVQQKIDEITKGKDLTDPAQIETIRAALTDYANAPNRSAEAIAEVNTFLDTLPSSTPEATDVLKPTESIDATSEPSTTMANERGEVPAEGITTPDGNGVDNTGTTARQLNAGEAAQPSALTTKPVENWFEGVEKAAVTPNKGKNKLVQMPIDQFLKLAERDIPGSRPDKEERVQNIINKSEKFSSVPYLYIETDDNGNAKVTGHEGRHRARALKALGYNTIPVELRSDIRWSEQQDPEKFDYKENWFSTLVGQEGDVVPFPVSRNEADIDYSATTAPVPNAPIAPIASKKAPPEGKINSNEAIAKLMASGLKRSEATQYVRGVEENGTVDAEDIASFVAQNSSQGLYRKGETPAPGEGMSQAQVQSIVDEVSKNWENAPKINVVQDIQELPQEIYQQMVRDKALDAPGLYDPETKIVHLIADNIASPKEAVFTLAHETLGHYGLRSILGHTYEKMMDDIYTGNAKVRGLADVKIKKGLDKRTAVEEVLAEMAEKDINNSAVQRVINAIKQWLRKMGFPFGSISDTEIRALLANANRFVHGGKFRAGEEAFGNKPLYREGAFQKWFGNSVVRNENGTPKVMYHGTSQDIHEFKPKQAGAIFVTDNPNFAHSFAEMSEGYMQQQILKSLSEEEFIKLDKQADAIAKKKGTFPGDELNALLQERLPSYANIIPVYVSAQKPFDYENLAHIEEIRAEFNKLYREPLSVKNIRSGEWSTIESKEVQAAIKAAGFDGFYVMEGGKKNLAVYEPSQIKSIFNKGTYDPADKRILYRTNEQELTPEGQEAAALNERMKGAGNPKDTNPDSILKKLLGVVQTREGQPSLGTRFRREFVDARATAVEKMEAKFNNTLVDSLGEVRGDLTQIQAQDSAAFAEGAMEHGGIQIGKDGLVEIVDRDATMGKVFDIMTKLGDRLGSLKTALQLGHNAFIAQRAKELNAHNAKIAQDIVAAEAKGNKKAVEKLREMLITHYVTDEEIAAADEAMQKFPELKEAFKTFTEYKNNLIDFLVQTGRISQGKANEWKEAAGYVPWTRVEEEVNIFDESPASFKGGIANISKLRILDREGSHKEIANVFDNMIGLTSWAVKTGMNAYASRRMAESLPDAFEIKTPGALADAQKHKKDRLIFSYKDGERTAYLLGSALDRSAFASNIVTLGPILKTFSFAQSTLRSFVTHMPAFAVSQLIQDGTYRAMLLSGVKHPFSLPAKVAKNFMHAMAGKGIPLELARIGVSGVYDGMPQHAIDRARVKYGLEERNGFKKAWDKLEKFSLAADLAVRAAIYEQTINETKSAEMPEGDRRLALYRAKEYINFKHAGDSTVIGTLRHMVPFLNAYIQGMDILVRTMRGKGISMEEKRAAQKLFLATGLKIAAMSTLYAMLVGDDEDYKGMEGYERDKNYIIPGTGLKIPVAPEVGFMFKVIPERIVQYVVSQGTERPQDATAFYKGFKDAFINAYGGTNLTPQLIKPSLEVLTNYSFFTGNPIVGAGMKNLDPSMQFTEGTSELAKLFGMAGVSPMKADYLIRGYTGMLGAFVLDATDAVANPDRMGKPVSKLPQLSTFMYDTMGRGYKSEFYGFREAVDQVVDTVNMFKREGRMEELKDYLTEAKMKLYAMKGVVHKAETQLANLRKYRNIIANDPQMPSDLKREKTDEILKQEKELLLAYNVPKLRGMAEV